MTGVNGYVIVRNITVERNACCHKQVCIFDYSKWFTSGRRDSLDPVKFFWNGDGEIIEGFQSWLDDTDIFTEGNDIIVYLYNGRHYFYSRRPFSKAGLFYQSSRWIGYTDNIFPCK